MKTKLYRKSFRTTCDVTKYTKINTVWCLNSKSQSKRNNQLDDLTEKITNSQTPINRSDDLTERGNKPKDTAQPKLTISIICILTTAVTVHNLLSNNKV